MPIGRMQHTDITPIQSHSQPGMAHFGGTGPQHTWCQSCIFLIWRKGLAYCHKYEEIMGKEGPPIAPSNKSCRYYLPEKPPKKATPATQRRSLHGTRRP